MIGPDLHDSAVSRTLQIAQQHFVLKHAARKHQRMRAMRPAQTCCTHPHIPRDAPLKRSRNLLHVSPPQPVANHSLQQRPKIQFAAGKRKCIALNFSCSSRQTLQPHRRLSLKRCLARKAQQRRRRVEQPSHRTSSKTSYATFCVPIANDSRYLAKIRMAPPPNRQIRKLPGNRQPPAPEIPPQHRRPAAWPSQVSHTLKARAHAARQKSRRPRSCHHRHSLCRRS